MVKKSTHTHTKKVHNICPYNIKKERKASDWETFQGKYSY